MDYLATKKAVRANPDEALIALVELLASIDTTADMAKLNAITISDNNGRRILL